MYSPHSGSPVFAQIHGDGPEECFCLSPPLKGGTEEQGGQAGIAPGCTENGGTPQEVCLSGNVLPGSSERPDSPQDFLSPLCSDYHILLILEKAPG